MSANFKTCMFGGFDRRDVIAFIEKTARENREIIDSLEKSNEELTQKCSEMEQELELLREESASNAQQAQQAAELSGKLENLTAQCEKLENENDTLRHQAQEYLAMKDHIAEIEISAHHRTEEFRAAAVAQLREILNAQRAWCDQTRQQYVDLSGSFAEKLQQAQQTVSSVDTGAFDDMKARLQSLDDRLDEPEEKE